jgi:hypothetical protein
VTSKIPPFVIEVMTFINDCAVLNNSVHSVDITRFIAHRRGVKRHTNFNQTVANALIAIHARDWGFYLNRGRFSLSEAGRKALKEHQ